MADCEGCSLYRFERTDGTSFCSPIPVPLGENGPARKMVDVCERPDQRTPLDTNEKDKDAIVDLADKRYPIA